MGGVSGKPVRGLNPSPGGAAETVSTHLIKISLGGGSGQGSLYWVQWLRIRLPLQGTQVRSMVQKAPTSSGLQVGSLKISLLLGDLGESNLQLFRLPRAPLYLPCQKRGFLSVLDKKYLSAISICVKQVISDHFDPNIKFF